MDVYNWSWQRGQGRVAYDVPTSEIIEKSYVKGAKFVDFRIEYPNGGYGYYKIDFSTFIQHNIHTKCRRKVYREKSQIHAHSEGQSQYISSECRIQNHSNELPLTNPLPSEAIDQNKSKVSNKTQSNESPSEEQTCKICLDQKIEYIAIPCGHAYLCTNCAKMEVKNCAICRGVVTQTYRIYLS
jgi:hypothetical protein